ncbi:MAG TPA: hypothetical protein VI248_12190 [Kineosporiaceae bacterium]
MALYDNANKKVYSWDAGPKSGGKETWWYTPGEGARIQLEITGNTGIPGGSNVERTYTGNDLTVDHCFLVQAAGHVKDTGDSATGGCTPQ